MNADATMTLAPQHLRALAKANEVRLARAGLKRRVSDGEVTVAGVMLDMPAEADTMPVLDLLMSQRRWGLTRCRKFLRDVQMPENKTVGSMTMRQRTAVAAMLATAGAGAPRTRELEPAL